MRSDGIGTHALSLCWRFFFGEELVYTSSRDAREHFAAKWIRFAMEMRHIEVES